MIMQVVCVSLEDISRISCLPRCFGTRTRLLSFAIAVLHSAQKSHSKRMKRHGNSASPLSVKPQFRVRANSLCRLRGANT